MQSRVEIRKVGKLYCDDSVRFDNGAGLYARQGLRSPPNCLQMQLADMESGA